MKVGGQEDGTVKVENMPNTKKLKNLPQQMLE